MNERQRFDLAQVQLLAQALVAAGAGMASVADPVAGAVATTAAPITAATLGMVFDWISDRSQKRRGALIRLAARHARISVGELLRRCEADPRAEELFIRSIRAAQDAGFDTKVVAFAIALGNGVVSTQSEVRAWESGFVHAVDDLDEAHLDLLSRFTYTSNELGLGDGSPDFDRVVRAR